MKPDEAPYENDSRSLFLSDDVLAKYEGMTEEDILNLCEKLAENEDLTEDDIREMRKYMTQADD